MIKFTVAGAGVLQAIGNGNPVNTEDYFGCAHSVHEGRGMAALRSGDKSGVISLKAESDALKSAQIEVIVE
jgi:hypothetical protein